MNRNSFLRQTHLVLGIALLSVTVTASPASARKAPEPGDGTTQATPLGKDSTRMIRALQLLADLLAQANYGGTKALQIECDVPSTTFTSRSSDANVQRVVDLFNMGSEGPRAELCRYGVADINAAFAATAAVLANPSIVFPASATMQGTAAPGAWMSDADGDVFQGSHERLRWRFVGTKWKRSARPILDGFERFATALNLGADAYENIVVHVDAEPGLEQGGRNGYAYVQYDPAFDGTYPAVTGTKVGLNSTASDKPFEVSEGTCRANADVGKACVISAFTSTKPSYVPLFDANKTMPAGMCTVKINGVTKAWVANDGGNFLWPMKFQTSAFCSSSGTRCKAACPIATDSTSCVQSVSSTMPAGMTITCP